MKCEAGRHHGLNREILGAGDVVQAEAVPDDDVRIDHIDLFKDFAVSVEKSHALAHLRLHNFKTGTWTAIAFPEPVYSVFPGGTPEYESTTYRYNYQSLITPSSIFDYDTRS